MRITAITRFKHGRLHAALKQLGWSHRELGERVGFGTSRIGLIVNLQYRPSEALALQIEKVLADAGVACGDILEGWPPQATKRKPLTIEQTQDVEFLSLECDEVLALPAPDADPCDEANRALMRDALKDVLTTLTEDEQSVIKLCIYEELSTTEAAHRMHMGWNTVDKLLAKAIRKLRHPTRIRHLEGFLELAE